MADVHPLLTLLLGFSLACAGEGQHGNAPPEAASMAGRNIILISIDSLRADHLSCYGYDRPTSPEIDALAAGATLFEQATSQAPWTLPSHASLFTSLYPRAHQATALDRSLPAAATTFASELKRAGYSTHAIVSGPFMQASFGMDKGFDSYDQDLALGGHSASHKAVTSGQIHRRVTRLLDDAHDPFFLFLHYWDVHYDYIPPVPFDTEFDPDYQGDLSADAFMQNKKIGREMSPRDLQHLVALYDGEIRWVDHHIGLLLAELKQRNLDQQTLVILTADHGDEFFEHGGKGHSHSLYEELTHVPLIMRVPGQSGRRIRERVQLIDVMPTLLELVGVPIPDRLQGRTLLPLLRGDKLPSAAAISETTRTRKGKQKGPNWSQAQAVYRDEFKLIHYPDGRYPDEVYDLARDPGETDSITTRKVLADLYLLLEAWKESTSVGLPSRTPGPDPETLEELQQLGYVGD